VEALAAQVRDRRLRLAVLPGERLLGILLEPGVRILELDPADRLARRTARRLGHVQQLLGHGLTPDGQKSFTLPDHSIAGEERRPWPQSCPPRTSSTSRRCPTSRCLATDGASPSWCGRRPARPSRLPRAASGSPTSSPGGRRTRRPAGPGTTRCRAG